MSKSGSGSAPNSETSSPERPHLHGIVADLTEGVILIEEDRRIVWANSAALVMHGCNQLDELGDTPKAYHDRFQLAYRDGKALPKSEYPLERLIGGECYSSLMVTLIRRDQRGHEHILQLRGTSPAPRLTARRVVSRW